MFSLLLALALCLTSCQTYNPREALQSRLVSVREAKVAVLPERDLLRYLESYERGYRDAILRPGYAGRFDLRGQPDSRGLASEAYETGLRDAGKDRAFKWEDPGSVRRTGYSVYRPRPVRLRRLPR